MSESAVPPDPSALPGKVACLSCSRVFDSPDRRRTRRCEACKKKDDPYERAVFRMSDLFAAMRRNR